MTQQDLAEFKCSDSDNDDPEKSVKYVSLSDIILLKLYNVYLWRKFYFSTREFVNFNWKLFFIISLLNS